MAVASTRPEYSHIDQTLSELGTVGRRNAAWMNAAGIIPAGILVAVSAAPLLRAFGSDALSRAGATVLAIAGAAFVMAGLFPWVGGRGDITHTSSRIHLASAIVGFAGLGFAPLLFAFHARRAPAVRRWFIVSFVAGLITLMCALILANGAKAGLYQRGALVAFYGWLIATSIFALRHEA